MGDHQAQEGRDDQARGKMFSKYIKEITMPPDRGAATRTPSVDCARDRRGQVGEHAPPPTSSAR